MSLSSYSGIGQDGAISWKDYLEGNDLDSVGGPSGGGSFSGGGSDDSLTDVILDTARGAARQILDEALPGGYRRGYLDQYGYEYSGSGPRYTTSPDGRLVRAGGGSLFSGIGGAGSSQWLLIGAVGLLAVVLLAGGKKK